MRDPEKSRRITYEFRRYMNHLSDEFLKTRAKDVFFNRAVSAPTHALVNAPPLGWDHLWRDVVDEARGRFGDTGGHDLMELVKAEFRTAWNARPRLSSEAVRRFIRRAPTRPFSVRYSKRKYLEDLVRYGRIRISSASCYNDPSLNPAVRDEELELAIQPNPSEYRFEVIDPQTREVRQRIPVRGNIITTRAPTDYYILCMSDLLAPYLFYDFDADACVVFTKTELFLDRLVAALSARLPGEWIPAAARVQYVDPLNCSLRHFKIYIAKHFRYAYQQECRFVYCPASGDTNLLEPLEDLRIGNMEDCCELLCP